MNLETGRAVARYLWHIRGAASRRHGARCETNARRVGKTNLVTSPFGIAPPLAALVLPPWTHPCLLSSCRHVTALWPGIARPVVPQWVKAVNGQRTAAGSAPACWPRPDIRAGVAARWVHRARAAMACAVRWSTPGCQESRPTHRLQHRLSHHFRLPLPARRRGAVAQERRQHALVAEVLAPGLELLRVLADALAELCQGGPEAVRVEERQPHSL